MKVEPEEEWRPIDGWPYEVSSIGRVRNNRTGHILTLAPHHQSGYPMAVLSAGGKRRNVGVHREVCIAFHGPPPTPLHEVAHEDGNSANARRENLTWKTHLENERDKKRHGTGNAGSRHGHAKLTDGDVVAIRADQRSLSAIAATYGVSFGNIGRIKRGEMWKHVA